MRKVIALVGVFAVALLAGCNTVQGFGKDLEKGGEAIQKVAK
ncbi:MAG: entericidin A/B family lipoprotein [Zoogloea sp.]|jgi:entericidin B|nr:entericidin A/B family lipoprotein [Dokdonella sp.]MBL0283565.1 entericidin A/B family lipoprotein [Zoogloea sp.]MBP7790336.1 entericidin A/B family lipoprotein [Zoogloea sp.]